MRLIDLSFDRPAQNLALDEALLDAAEADKSPSTLRFWESPTLFVVLGVAQKLVDEVDETACRRDGVPILRRCSAGGAVLQGRGCLNYSLILRLDDFPQAKALRESYCLILGRIVDALTSLGVKAAIQGTSDLAVDGVKFSGNAQKRRRRAILHHGTLLYEFDLAAVTRYLREPEQRPEYRGRRMHREFVGNLPLDSIQLRNCIGAAFQVDPTEVSPGREESERAIALRSNKYDLDTWVRRR